MSSRHFSPSYTSQPLTRLPPLSGINVSGASVNPARTLGPALVNANVVPEFWIYFLGPTLGAALGAGVHWLLTALAYQTANPGQDGDGMEYYRVVPPSNERAAASPSSRSSSSLFDSHSASFFKFGYPQAAVTRLSGLGGRLVPGEEGQGWGEEDERAPIQPANRASQDVATELPSQAFHWPLRSSAHGSEFGPLNQSPVQGFHGRFSSRQ